MMKHGKSISIEELVESVRCALRCRWRRKQALLLLSLQTGEVAYWQNGEHSWQEQLNEECLADKQRLTDALREILLARDVEEGAAVLLLPAAATVYSEQLLLPLMRRRELQAALNGKYSRVFLGLKRAILIALKQQNLVKLENSNVG